LYVKVYRYLVKPDAEERFLDVQRRSAEIYREHANAVPVLLRRRGHGAWLELQWFPDQAAYDKAMAAIDADPKIEALFKVFRETLADPEIVEADYDHVALGSEIPTIEDILDQALRAELEAKRGRLGARVASLIADRLSPHLPEGNRVVTSGSVIGTGAPGAWTAGADLASYLRGRDPLDEALGRAVERGLRVVRDQAAPDWPEPGVEPGEGEIRLWFGDPGAPAFPLAPITYDELAA
jgi:hypothetical protein